MSAEPVEADVAALRNRVAELEAEVAALRGTGAVVAVPDNHNATTPEKNSHTATAESLQMSPYCEQQHNANIALVFKLQGKTEADLRVEFDTLVAQYGGNDGRLQKQEVLAWALTQEAFGLPLKENDFERMWLSICGRGRTLLSFPRFVALLIKMRMM